ncbi:MULTISPECIES: cache domain-containing sensor histidine kinase [Paenibacillus]|uniref:cache domain-containing sensor histidine kinase n=1 Tax=Paenibacillus TaxID=44249 RepID=UPI0022B92D1F|nr:sensor histidine kinase [Paenibacillus caseinilyticus]MCZ8522269.1 sensor histidine kinase [Paenibacillus caseinilyticus]
MKLSFQLKLIAGLSVIIFLSCGLSGYLSYTSQLRLFEEEVGKQYEKTVEGALSHLELRIGEMYRISNYIVFNNLIEKAVTELMQNRDGADIRAYEAHNRLEDLLRQVKLDAPFIDSLYLYDLEGHNYYFGHMKETLGNLDPEVFQQIKSRAEASSGELVWTRVRVPSYVERAGYSDAVIAARWLRNKALGTYGLLVMVLDESLLGSPLQELSRGDRGGIYLYDAQDRLLYLQVTSGAEPPLSELQGGQRIRKEGGERYLYAVHSSATYDWTLVSRVSLASLQDKSRVTLNMSLVSALVSIVLGGLLIVLLSGRLTRPLKELVKAMRVMREGNFDVRIRPRSHDELAFIGESFNTMAANVRSLIDEVYVRQLSEREAELKAIQAQLNPHFLYNTLNGLYWKLYVKDDRESAELVSALSGLLRYSLERADTDTVLREELRQIGNYLDIQKAFVENRFEAAVEAEEAVQACAVPRLLLQPLVENVFVHAFRSGPEDKRLSIRAYAEEGMLLVDITDNGSGMEETELARLLRPVSVEEGVRPSIGIRNVLRRIDLVYGEPYGLGIESTPGHGTRVRVRLPMKVQADAGVRPDAG